MHPSILMLAAATGLFTSKPLGLPACPDLAQFSKQSTPLKTAPNNTLSAALMGRLHPAKGDSFVSTKTFETEGIRMSVFIMRKQGPAAYAHIYGICSAPWGQMVCGQADMKSVGSALAPEVEMRLYNGHPVALFTDKSGGKTTTTGWTFSQNSGFQAVCKR